MGNTVEKLQHGESAHTVKEVGNPDLPTSLYKLICKLQERAEAQVQADPTVIYLSEATIIQTLAFQNARDTISNLLVVLTSGDIPISDEFIIEQIRPLLDLVTNAPVDAAQEATTLTVQRPILTNNFQKIDCTLRSDSITTSINFSAWSTDKKRSRYLLYQDYRSWSASWFSKLNCGYTSRVS